MEMDRRGRLPWAIVILIMLFAFAFAYAGATIYTRFNSVSSFASYTTVRLDTMKKLRVVDDGFICYDGSTLTKYGTSSNIQWSYIVGADADFTAQSAGIAAWTGSKLTLLDGSNGSPSYSGNMDGSILSARMGSEYAAALLGPEHDSTIVLMETGGRRIDTIKLSDQTVIDYGFFYNDTLFWVMTLDTNGTVPSCTVSTYRPGRRLVGSITDTSQTLYHATFQSSQITCTGDTYMRVYTYNGTEDASGRRLVYGWTLTSTDDAADYPLMAFTLNGQYATDDGIRDVRMFRGDREQIVRMPAGCMDLVARGNNVYGFSPDGRVMIAQLGRRTVDMYQLILQFDTVYGMTENKTAILGNGSDIYLVYLGLA